MMRMVLQGSELYADARYENSKVNSCAENKIVAADNHFHIWCDWWVVCHLQNYLLSDACQFDVFSYA